MVFFRILSGGASCYAHDWWAGSYIRMLCPEAKVESQRISEFFEALGNERVQRRFLPQYLKKISEGQKNHGILIDSTGMPNDIHFPLAAINNHNGVVSNETRLILAIDRITSMPLLYRYVAGNIVDVTTLKSTILELNFYGVNVDFSILDAGYYSEENVRSLYAEGIRFLTRLRPNLKLYKALVDEHIDGLESRTNAVFYRNRLLYIKHVPIILPDNNKAYAYIALDYQRRHDEIYSYMKKVFDDKQLSNDEIDQKAKSKGIFIILSSESVEISEILPMYYTRQAIEQVFDFYKNNVDLLPLRTHGEETFRGHLMLSFLSTIAYMLANKSLDGIKFCADGAFRALRNLKCKVFDDCILVKEAPKKVNDIAKHLKIGIPLRL
jgi:transposase